MVIAFIYYFGIVYNKFEYVIYIYFFFLFKYIYIEINYISIKKVIDFFILIIIYWDFLYFDYNNFDFFYLYSFFIFSIDGGLVKYFMR